MLYIHGIKVWLKVRAKKPVFDIFSALAKENNMKAESDDNMQEAEKEMEKNSSVVDTNQPATKIRETSKEEVEIEGWVLQGWQHGDLISGRTELFPSHEREKDRDLQKSNPKAESKSEPKKNGITENDGIKSASTREPVESKINYEKRLKLLFLMICPNLVKDGLVPSKILEGYKGKEPDLFRQVRYLRLFLSYVYVLFLF